MLYRTLSPLSHRATLAPLSALLLALAISACGDGGDTPSGSTSSSSSTGGTGGMTGTGGAGGMAGTGGAGGMNCGGSSNCAGDSLWSKRFGDKDDQSGVAIAVDASGNALISGVLLGTADLGGGPLTSAGDSDIFIAKFDPTGGHLWSKNFGDANTQAALGTAVDAAGNALITGALYGTVDFGGGPLTSAGNDDIFLAKFDPAGNHLWSKSFGDANRQSCHAIAVDAAGNVLLTRGFEGTVDFGGGPLTSAGLNDIFVAKLDPAGNHLWSKSFGDAASQISDGLAVDATGNVLITGSFQGTVDLGGGPLTSAGLNDIFVAKLDPAGNHLWSKRFGDAAKQTSYGVAVDAAGNVLVSGYFQGTMDFGGGPLTSAGLDDIFVAKFDPAGNHLWSKRFGDAAKQNILGVAVDAAGNVLLPGIFQGTVDFGGGPFTAAGNSNIALVKLDPAGNHLWSKSFGDIERQIANGIAVDALGHILLTGSLRGTTDFGSGPLTSAGNDDIFVAKLSP